MRPSPFARRSSSTPSATVVANGLSTTTSRPAARHCRASGKCVSFGVAMTTRRIDSMASNSSTLRTIRASGNIRAAESPVRESISRRVQIQSAQRRSSAWPSTKRQQCITRLRCGWVQLPPAASWFPLRQGYILFLVERTPAKHQGPARGLYLGLGVTIVAVLAYGAYITMQFAGVRKLQGELVDRNRRDSLQLLRIQNDLNSIALAMRDMLDAGEPYPLIAWSAQLARIRADLDDAMLREEPLGEATRTTDQRRYLAQSLNQFWDANDRMFARAQSGDEQGAREQIRDTLQPRQAALISAVSRLLVQNTEGEEQAAARIAQIYDRVQRQLYFFLAAILLAIVVTSLYLIRNNRRLFAHVAELSSQRSELAQQLIATQESTLRHISRELHDEFGQILTAIGSLLRR